MVLDASFTMGPTSCNCHNFQNCCGVLSCESFFFFFSGTFEQSAEQLVLVQSIECTVILSLTASFSLIYGATLRSEVHVLQVFE